MTPLLCNEFKIIVQEILDGRPVNEDQRRNVREHRRTCDSCCGFHDGLLGVAALAPEMDLPEEFTDAQSSKLWNRIVTSLDVSKAHEQLAATLSLSDDVELPPVVEGSGKSFPLSKLDASKIDVPEGAEPGRHFDFAKFLFGPDEMENFAKVTDPSNRNARVERIGQGTLDLLAKLQDLVFDLPTVTGTMVLSPGGTILDSRLARDMRNEQSRDDIGVWSLAAFHNAQAAANAFGFDRVTQIVSRTDSGGYVIIANLEGLTLIVLIDGSEDDAWNAVARLGAVTK